MGMALIHFDMRAPGLEPAESRRLYGAAMEMAAFADKKGFDLCVLSEHHGTDDGYMPSPLMLGAAIAGCTERMPMIVSALLVPLHNPVRLAEDLAVLDLLSGGRISIVTGLGYRPSEYEMLGIDWATRGKRLDECLEVLLKAWTGEPFEYQGRTVRVTPRPLQQPHPTVFVGGSGPAGARRAARFGLGYFPPIHDESLRDLYYDECRRHGHEPGWVMMPPVGTPATVYVAHDPDAAWARLGPYLLHDAMTYASWQTPDIRSAAKAEGTTIEELRAEGVYQIVTPDECVELARRMGPAGGITHKPLCGGCPPELAWESLELFVDNVLPRMRAEA